MKKIDFHFSLSNSVAHSMNFITSWEADFMFDRRMNFILELIVLHKLLCNLSLFVGWDFRCWICFHESRMTNDYMDTPFFSSSFSSKETQERITHYITKLHFAWTMKPFFALFLLRESLRETLRPDNSWENNEECFFDDTTYALFISLTNFCVSFLFFLVSSILVDVFFSFLGLLETPSYFWHLILHLMFPVVFLVEKSGQQCCLSFIQCFVIQFVMTELKSLSPLKLCSCLLVAWITMEVSVAVKQESHIKVKHRWWLHFDDHNQVNLDSLENSHSASSFICCLVEGVFFHHLWVIQPLLNSFNPETMTSSSTEAVGSLFFNESLYYILSLSDSKCTTKLHKTSVVCLSGGCNVSIVWSFRQKQWQGDFQDENFAFDVLTKYRVSVSWRELSSSLEKWLCRLSMILQSNLQ